MKKQKKALSYAKIQALYLLKIQAVETIRYLTVVMGRSESTVHYWLQLYREGGLERLLEEPPKTGRPNKIGVETVAKIQQELHDPKGFVSYKEIGNSESSKVMFMDPRSMIFTIEGVQSVIAQNNNSQTPYNPMEMNLEKIKRDL